MAIEFRRVGLLEQRPPVHEVRLAHHEGLSRGGRLSMGDPSTLGLMVNRHIHKVTERAHRHHQPADRGPLVTRPTSEIQDHVRSDLQCLQTQPEQPPFQHIALPIRLRIAEQRKHPLIRCQPQRVVLLGQLSSSRGLSGPGQANRQEQRRHAQILSRRPSDHGLSHMWIEAMVTVPWKTWALQIVLSKPMGRPPLLPRRWRLARGFFGSGIVYLIWRRRRYGRLRLTEYPLPPPRWSGRVHRRPRSSRATRTQLTGGMSSWARAVLPRRFRGRGSHDPSGHPRAAPRPTQAVIIRDRRPLTPTRTAVGTRPSSRGRR